MAMSCDKFHHDSRKEGVYLNEKDEKKTFEWHYLNSLSLIDIFFYQSNSYKRRKTMLYNSFNA